ncbi:MAG: DUF4493 domain-containing protein [Bacteroides sp.]|nr:DUF4493 domain-containing protein [Bacteroides sp.]
MRKFSKGLCLFAFAAAVSMTSCSDESPFKGSDETGAITLNLTADGRVMRATRATEGDAVSSIVPRAEDFAITLKKIDGSYSKTWSTIDGFNRETAFPIGDYSIEATYTAPGASETDEGFAHAVFKGVSEAVRVSPSSTTNVSITATLANAMVSVRYTDAFRAYFSKYNTSIQTPGHTSVTFGANEDRPAFINPAEEVAVNLTIENEAGEKVVVRPATFTALPRHHVVITYDINSSTGESAIEVEFDEDVVAETIDISLGDLWTAPAPVIRTTGIAEGETLEILEGLADKECNFDLLAFGGIKSATLNVIGGHMPAFGSSVELVNASADTQAKLAAEGVDCAGLFRNVDKMGIVRLKDFFSHLPVGSHTIELSLVDQRGHVVEQPASVSVTVNPVDFDLSAPMADFLSNELVVEVSATTPMLRDQLSFLVPNENGQFVNAPVKSISNGAASVRRSTRGAFEYVYTYVLDVAPITGSTVDVKAFFNNKEREIKVDVDVPDYDLQVDAFATLAKIKIVPKVATDMAELMQNIDFYNDGVRFTGLQEERDSENGVVTLYGLTPGIEYVAIEARLGKLSKTVAPFRTEAAEDLPNSAFTSTRLTIDLNPINAGGQYKYLTTTMINYSAIVVYEPEGWASINEKTCYTGSTTKNTWFMVPSTLASNGEVEIRSVAYDHNGTMPDLDNHGLSVRAKYSRNAPKSFAYKSAGELFLGSYSFDGTEHRVDGIDFSSRPASLSFNYKYEPVMNEHGEAVIQVVNAAGEVIATGSLDLNATPEYTERTIPLVYSNERFNNKAASIRVGFKSAKGANVAAPVPSSFQDVTNTTSVSNHEIPANEYKSLCVGSRLWINRVSLSYDFPTSTPQANKRARKVRK